MVGNLNANLYIRRSDPFSHWTETSRMKFPTASNTETVVIRLLHFSSRRCVSLSFRMTTIWMINKKNNDTCSAFISYCKDQWNFVNLEDPLALNLCDWMKNESNLLPIEQIFVKPDRNYDFLPEDNIFLSNNELNTVQNGSGKNEIKSELHFNVVLSKNACQGLDATKETAVYLVHKTDDYVVLNKEVFQYVIVVHEDVKRFFVGEKSPHE